MSLDWSVVVDSATIEGLRVPRVEIAPYALIELCLPAAPGSRATVGVLDHLIAKLQRHARTVEVARAFNPRTDALIARLLARRLADRLSRTNRVERGAAVGLLRCCGVEPEQKADLIPWYEGKLIGFELAARRSEVVILDGGQLDPVNQHRFAEHVQVHQNKGLVVIVVQHPTSRGFMTWAGGQIVLIQREGGSGVPPYREMSVVNGSGNSAEGLGASKR